MLHKSFNCLLLLALFILLPAVVSSAKVIHIIGTADLQGIMTASKQKFDLNNDGKKEEAVMGGIANLATIFAKLKKENPNSVIVSVGDDLMNRYFHTYKGKAIFKLMSAAGYELYAFGNHEFDKGSSVLAEALDSASFTTLCSDLDVSTSKLKNRCLPLIIKEIEGVKVGFFSVMTEDLLMVTSEKNVKFIADNVTTAKKMVRLLKDKGAHVIVLLSHIGYKQDVALAKQVKGIDLIFGGHSHQYVRKMGRIRKTSIVNGGEKGTLIVKVDIPLSNDLKVLHKDVSMTYIPVTATPNPREDLEKMVEKYEKGFPPTIVLGKTETVWDMSSKELRKGESSVADMINDLMREKFKVDIVLNNGGAFRGKKVYPKGNITDKMLKEIDEFGNYAFTLHLKGKYFKEILERSAASYNQGGLLQTSGLKYRITLPKQVQKIKDRQVIRAGNRVDNIKVLNQGKWVDIDPEKTYTLLSNSFIVNHEGDGYFWFKKYGTNLKNTYTTFYSIMAEFIETHNVLSPKNKDGRLEIVY